MTAGVMTIITGKILFLLLGQPHKPQKATRLCKGLDSAMSLMNEVELLCIVWTKVLIVIRRRDLRLWRSVDLRKWWLA